MSHFGIGYNKFMNKIAWLPPAQIYSLISIIPCHSNILYTNLFWRPMDVDSTFWFSFCYMFEDMTVRIPQKHECTKIIWSLQTWPELWALTLSCCKALTPSCLSRQPWHYLVASCLGARRCHCDDIIHRTDSQITEAPHFNPIFPRLPSGF